MTRLILKAVFKALLCPLLFIASSSADDLVASGEYIIQRRQPHPNSPKPSGDVRYSVKSTSKFFEIVSVHEDKVGVKQAGGFFVKLDPVKAKNECDLIRRDSTVRTCEPNFVRSIFNTPNDPDFSSQWSLNNDAKTDIDAPEAWSINTGSKSVILGVIDTGIYGEHPDLASNLWSNPKEPVDGLDNDGNGYVDDVFGANVERITGDPSDCHGHGTHVSGIIGAAGNNGSGIAGVNWTTNMVVVSTAYDCSGNGTVAASIKAYDYFVDLKNRGYDIKAVNASFGGSQFVSAEYQAIERLRDAGILLVAAAGNSNRDSDITPNYPANYKVSNVINVGSLGPTVRRAYYSNYGQGVDLAAPGGDSRFSGGAIYSTWSPLATGGLLYKFAQGTSMAAPVVTGAIGLLASTQPTLSASDLKQMILNSAISVPELTGEVSGGRILNLARLLGYVPPSDNCPSDPAKNEPGICGCGIADTDLNNNRRWDCQEIGIAQLIPSRPSLKIVGRRVVVRMQQLPGVQYYVEVVTTAVNRGKKREKVSFYDATKNLGSLAKPARGTAVRVRYAFRTPGTTNDFSYWSPSTGIRIR